MQVSGVRKNNQNDGGTNVAGQMKAIGNQH